jgi:hypothetical protein
MQMRKRSFFTAAFAALFAVAAFGQAPSSEQITVPLSAPAQPGTLIVNHGRGNIAVFGYEGAVVIIKAAPAEPSGRGPDRNAPGMKWIAAGEIRMSASEDRNVVTVVSNSADKTIDLRILVPRKFNLKLSVKDNGGIEVDGVTGEMEINNINGPVRLDHLAGSALVNTVDGDIFGRFDRLAPGLPLAFTSVYGKIDVAFPPDADLTVKMKTDRGSIFSDFDIAVDQRKSLSEPTEKPGGRRISLEEWSSGKIGKGGTDVLLKSYEGNIYIRKSRAGRP